MAEHGKTLQAEQEKYKKQQDTADGNVNAKHAHTVSGLTRQLEELTKQKEHLDKIINEAPNLDEAVKAAVAEAEKANRATLAEMEKAHNAKLTEMQRDADTAAFFHNLGRKFVTPETESVFRQRMNDALTDRSNEGKNRNDIFTELIKGADGNERGDIFQTRADVSPFALGGNAAGPGSANSSTPPTGQEMKFNFTGIRGRGEAPIGGS